MLGLLTGHETIIVGLGETEGGALKVYLGHRSRGVYCVVTDECREGIQRAWDGHTHVVVKKPPSEALFSDELDALYLGRS